MALEERPWSSTEVTLVTENCFFFFAVNGHESSTAPVTCGVHQGSLLGPLLFIVYVNDIQKSSKKNYFILFADDSNLFYTYRDSCSTC